LWQQRQRQKRRQSRGSRYFAPTRLRRPAPPLPPAAIPIPPTTRASAALTRVDLATELVRLSCVTFTFFLFHFTTFHQRNQSTRTQPIYPPLQSHLDRWPDRHRIQTYTTLAATKRKESSFYQTCTHHARRSHWHRENRSRTTAGPQQDYRKGWKGGRVCDMGQAVRRLVRRAMGRLQRAMGRLLCWNH
jgi:hypothetical protein